MIQKDLETQKRASFAFTDDAIRQALRDLIEMLGYNELTMTPADKTVVAEKLSRVARHDPPWTWRYVHNLLLGKVDPSEKFSGAILRLLAVMDGADARMVRAVRVEVLALEPLNPGTLVLVRGRQCANPACPIEFIPVVPRQRFCCAECRRKGTRRPA